jgi:hypothetical protein
LLIEDKDGLFLHKEKFYLKIQGGAGNKSTGSACVKSWVSSPVPVKQPINKGE